MVILASEQKKKTEDMNMEQNNRKWTFQKRYNSQVILIIHFNILFVI